jgi:MFS family permease
MHRSALVFLGSYGLSILGNSVAAVVLPLVVLQTTGSATDAGVVAAATAVPAVLAGLFMGGVVDRVHRRKVSIATDLVSAAAIAALPIVDATVGLALGWFVLLGIVGSFGDVPGLTAREALLPDVARRSGVPLDRLVALRESVGGVVVLVGPAAAGGLVVLLDPVGALWLTAGTSFLAAVTTFLLPRDVGVVHRAPDRSARAALADVREGWTILVRQPFLRAVTLLNLVVVTVLAAVQGLLLPVHFTLQGQEGRLGLVLSALAAGTLVGSLAYAAAGARMPRRAWFVVGLVGSLGGIAVIGALPPVGVVLAGAALLGLFGGLLGTVTGVLMTERVPDAARGRVMGTQNAAITLAPSLGILGVALAVDHASLAAAGWALVAVWAVAVVAALLAPALRRLEPAGTAGMVE